MVQKIAFGDGFKVKCACVSPSGKWIGLGGEDGIIEIWSHGAMKLDVDLKF